MKHEIIDKGDPKYYWTQIPNIAFELGLTPYELTLYVHLKRAAGADDAGKCTKSTATLVRETRMGAGTVSRAKSELEKKRTDLNKKPLIKTRQVTNPRGGKPFQEITITDIWKENMARFASSREEIDAAEQVPVEVEPSSRPISPVEIKKNVEEEPYKEEVFTRYARQRDVIRCIQELQKAKSGGINIQPWIESVENDSLRRTLLEWAA